MKVIQQFADWLSDHAPLYGWEKGYQTLVHILWSWFTAIMLLVLAIFVSPNDIAFPIQILFGIITVVPFVQELIYSKINGTTYDISNVFACIVGGVIGGFLAGFVGG